MPDLPFLPKLDGTILLDVYTHSSLDYVGKPVNEEYGDNKRLADLGSCILNLAITQRLFSKRPMLSADEIAEYRNNFTSDSHIDDWVTVYQMKKDLRFAPSALEDIKSIAESRFLLNCHIGAVFYQKGMPPITAWIDRLVLPDPAPPEPSRPSYPPQTQPQSPTSPTSSAAFPPPAPLFPGSPGYSQGSMVSQLSMRAQKEGCTLSWQQDSMGPPHSLTWNVKCLVNNVEMGAGTGKSTKVAKDIAAAQAWSNLQWS